MPLASEKNMDKTNKTWYNCYDCLGSDIRTMSIGG